ncbi:MAG: chemotaxis protein [Nitrospirae bacterium]|nr:chemotaxis protein [Nitrospirota bacterium]
MNKFKNMGIGKQLGMGFGALLMIFMIATGMNTLSLRVVDNSSKQIAGETLPFLTRAYDMHVDVLTISDALTDVSATHHTDGFKEAEEAANKFKVDIGKFKEMFKNENDMKALAEAEELEANFNIYYENAQKMANVYIKNGMTAGNKVMEVVDKTRETLMTHLGKFQKSHVDEANENAGAIMKAVSKTRFVLFLMGGIAVVLGTLIAIGIVRNLLRQLGGEPSYVADIAHRVADGDLTIRIESKRNNETSLLASVDRMVMNLKRVVAQTIESSSQVSVAADQIADTNQSFSQKITEQAASVEETSATMEEMSATIKSTAENSREASNLSRNTKSLADGGSSVMQDTIKAMDDINKSANKIANISNVIGEIAFQTNLLALNAAVEAARAGEHGKGFAVVASEIRSLAGRTTQSAKEITTLIEDSSEKTSRGVLLAQELGKKLEEIGLGIKKVTDLMDEVAAAAQEQSTGINQVNTAMGQVDQATQQNASLVEETSAAAEELAAQAKGLLEIVSFFKVDNSDHTAIGKGPNSKAATQKSIALQPAKKMLTAVYAPADKKASWATAGASGGNGDFSEFH